MFNSQQEARAAGRQPLYDMARQMMWNRRGDKSDFAAGCLDKVQPEFDDYAKAYVMMQDQCIPCTNVINIPSINTVPSPVYSFFDRVIYTNYEAQQEKEQTMYAQASVNIDQSLDYINRRLNQIRDEKVKEAYKTFRMDDSGPRTVKELRAAIKAGDFKIKPYKGMAQNVEEDEDIETIDFVDCGYNWMSMFEFNSKKDEKGYQAARDAIYDAWQQVKDRVTIVTDEKSRLKALEEFQAFKA